MAYEALYTRGRPKTFAQLVGQEHISSAMTRAVLSDRLSHAYLLVGTRGTGKTSTARLLAKAMNCETVRAAVDAGQTLTAKDIPCNKCASCLSINSSPDNVEFDAASNRSVEDVTRLLSTAYLAPLQSRIKTFIIDEVHMLSFEAVNSILKLIEEPPPNVAFFLATTELQKVPMTIRSRCQVLNFRLIPTEIIAPYLQKLARRLEVELPTDAARKIARLAEGSMRDALTYLDQCYAMSDKIITLDSVNQTLGLISDADLDEIISALTEKNRAKLSAAITRALSSGLSSLSIAESLITRLRDLEIENLHGGGRFQLAELDRLIDLLRKTILEMQGSGIPDIIFEMALLTADKKNSSETPAQKISAPEKIPHSSLLIPNSLDGGKKIFYHMLRNSKITTASLLKQGVIVRDFDGKTLTLAFRNKTRAEMFNNHRADFSREVSELVGRRVEVDAVFDENISSAELYNVDEQAAKFLEDSKKNFRAEEILNLYDEEAE